MTAEYTIKIFDAYGQNPVEPKDWFVLDYGRVENDSAPLTLTLPGDYPDTWKKDGIITVERALPGGVPHLETNTAWPIRRWTWDQPLGKDPFWTLYAYDLNSLIKLPKVDRRVIDYDPGIVGTTAILDTGPNMGRILMNKNFFAPTDPSRKMQFLTVEPLDGPGAQVAFRKDFGRTGVMQALQDIASTSYQHGTYVVFDIVVGVMPGLVMPMQFEFRAFTGQRGQDHTRRSSAPILIGPEYNNLVNVTYDVDYTGEVTRGIAVGQTFGITQVVARQSNQDLINESPFGLTEGVRSASGDAAANADSLVAEAQAELQAGIPLRTITGTIQDTDGLTYGREWSWGDVLTGQVRGRSFDAHVSRIHVHAERNVGETIQGVLTGVL